MTYRVERGGQTFDAPPRTVDVDLSVPGAVNPGEPGTANINLRPLQIFGQGSLVPNELREVHANQDVTVSIELWTVADPPQAGQFIHVVWSDGTVVAPPFAITTQLPGDTITFPIPWSVVAATGNGPQIVHYFVASSATPLPTDNISIAPDTTVNVIDAVTLALVPPEFLRFQTTLGVRTWTCDSLVVLPRAVAPARDTFEGRILVPADPRFQLGQQLTLVVRAFQPRVGVVREDASVTLTLPITVAGQVNGYTFVVPFDTLRALRLTGTVQATSSSPLVGGFLGRGTASMNGRAVLSRDYCDAVPVPALPPLP
ncbi:hypothetical protein LRS56_13075 [Pseudomonas poae]|nr:hypothetical protein LRS56_13075 [Pseudomonas poae]